MRRPEKFGKYLLLDRISVGGMAEVFKARAFGVQGFARLVAIKKILPHLAEDKRFVEMFITEAKTAVQLNHANIAQIQELGREGDDHYIAMEYVSGKDLLSLHHHFRRTGERLPVELVAHVAERVAEGLDYAHRKRGQDGRPLGIVHRDVSPQNVLVSYEGAVKLIDFGIAKARFRSFESTQGGALKGKFGYMSPELIEAGDVDHRSDIFALGTVTWELLARERLFIADNDFATLERVRQADVQPPSALNPDVPPALDRIVLRALARDPGARYQTAGDLAEDLARYLHGAGRPVSTKALSDWMKSRFGADLAKERASDEAQARWVLTPSGEVTEIDPVEDEETALWDPLSDEELSRPIEPAAPDPFASLVEPETAPERGSPGREARWPTPTPTPAPRNEREVPTPLPFQPQDPDRRFGRRPTPARGALRVVAVVALLLAAGAALWLLWPLAPPAADDAGLVVRVDPVDRAAIFLDGAQVSNRSPLLRRNLSPGEHLVRVEAEGFRPWARTVELESGALAELVAELEPVGGPVARLRFVTEPPDAELTVDGDPYDRRRRDDFNAFPAGQPLALVAQHPDFVTRRGTVTPEAGERRTVTWRLAPRGGTLFVDSVPPADVFLDGRRVGRTPHTETGLDTQRPWRLELAARGYRRLQKTLRFGPEKVLQVEERLERR